MSATDTDLAAALRALDGALCRAGARLAKLQRQMAALDRAVRAEDFGLGRRPLRVVNARGLTRYTVRVTFVGPRLLRVEGTLTGEDMVFVRATGRLHGARAGAARLHPDDFRVLRSFLKTYRRTPRREACPSHCCTPWFPPHSERRVCTS